MGTCSSVHKSKMPLVPSQRKKEPANGGNNPVKMVATGFRMNTRQIGSKGEVFFDSRAWLDSDCEDDFFSVNGDSTPSRGHPPNNQCITLLPASSRCFTLDDLPNSDEASPTARKKLADLFQETLQLNPLNDEVETGHPINRANTVSISESRLRPGPGHCSDRYE